MSDHRAFPIEYDALRDSLACAGVILALPELHGGICGALCASGLDAALTWIDEGLSDEPNARAASDLRSSLHGLVTTSWELLSSAALEFAPLLPDDEAPLDEQAHALATWCHGFLGGLGFAAPDLGIENGAVVDGSDAAAVHLGEICADFAEISRAGVTEDDAADRDAAEFALAELSEYVRVSVQIAFEALAARRASLSSRRALH